MSACSSGDAGSSSALLRLFATPQYEEKNTASNKVSRGTGELHLQFGCFQFSAVHTVGSNEANMTLRPLFDFPAL
jgi:hypothetical protein